MSLFWIKIIAILTMAVDHLGVFVFPENIYFRIIGRLSFPLFAWAIANGSIYSKDTKKYLLRLFVLAIISQIPYQLVFNSYGVTDPGLNILFTLSLGLLGIIFIKDTNNTIIHIFIASILSFVAFVINANYGAFGVLCIISFYRFFGSRIKKSLSYIFLLLTFFLILPFSVSKNVSDIFEMSYMNFIQIFSIFSLFFICAYNNKVGHKMKYFFYLFYPLHLFFIFILKLFVF